VRRWLKENPQVKEKVHFLPFRKDAVKLMADFDVLLLTSDAEGMPLVVLEALNQGVLER
jgi:glycosyltransferase involved in cell wall biosynthesis